MASKILHNIYIQYKLAVKECVPNRTPLYQTCVLIEKYAKKQLYFHVKNNPKKKQSLGGLCQGDQTSEIKIRDICSAVVKNH